MPQIAALVCVALIAFLFWIDRRRVDGVSQAIWIPYIWMFFAGSRFASQWLSLGTPGDVTTHSYDDGSPLDRAVFVALILAAAWVLARRRVDWAGLVRRNAWILLFFAYAATSAMWADDPGIALKRWVKGVGTLLMALLIATERRPDEALGFVLRRLAFAFVPLSILFIRFFPDLGRAYHMGTPMFTGVTFQKNSLGQLCLYLAIYVGWALLYKRRSGRGRRGNEYALPMIIVAPMLLWVLYMSHSATSIALAAIGVGVLTIVRMQPFRRAPRNVVPIVVVVAGAIVALLATTDIKDTLIRAMGRDPDLTDRAPVWALLLQMAPNPMFGAGYESFWSGSRMAEIWARVGAILQAHNGYLDLYLNLGWVGVALLMFAVLVSLGMIARRFREDYADGALRLTFVIVVLVYNYTEAAFKPLNNLFLLLLFSVVHVRALQKAAPRSSVPVGSDQQIHRTPETSSASDHGIGQDWRPRFR